MNTNARLDVAGVFTANGPDGTAHLFYDGADAVGRWIVARAESGSVPAPLSRHADIDQGLRSLMETAGLDSRRFSVDLPCGRVFSRPGRVDASSVLAAYGYVITRGITTYVILEAKPRATAAQVHESLAERLNGRAMGIGSVMDLERNARKSYWLCDLVLPFEGPLRAQDAKDYLDREFEGTELSLAEGYELLPAVPVVANASSVIAFRPTAQAA